MRKYFKEARDEFVHQLDRGIDKALFATDLLYTPELLRLIRQKKH
jgi:hypothetical protein